MCKFPDLSDHLGVILREFESMAYSTLIAPYESFAKQLLPWGEENDVIQNESTEIKICCSHQFQLQAEQEGKKIVHSHSYSGILRRHRKFAA
ncbi:hypothetical protein NPIL_636271 [Nephila pilipes]|uniref:Uncharacterized protein n=1 Tax=Nephila pilipes TaxID=299642 RepID=A0A8X6UE40_NEPPI|nr:hypothetical protein NPIL_636271 [Nephila pilipes]